MLMTDDDICLELINNLNLDEVDDTKVQIASMMKQAEAMLINAINSTVPTEVYLKNRLFIAAVEALTTQIFYDRTLENNFSLGVQSMIVQLQASYADYDGGDQNGNA